LLGVEWGFNRFLERFCPSIAQFAQELNVENFDVLVFIEPVIHVQVEGADVAYHFVMNDFLSGHIFQGRYAP